MSGSWQDGTLWTNGGTGYQSGGTKANFCFPDFPYNSSGWNDFTSGLSMGDRRDVASCGPFALRPGATTDFDFAVV
ncbi:MAG TPA: hypothetical protein VII99_11280 [Bacteroidia bacterium]